MSANKIKIKVNDDSAKEDEGKVEKKAASSRAKKTSAKNSKKSKASAKTVKMPKKRGRPKGAKKQEAEELEKIQEKEIEEKLKQDIKTDFIKKINDQDKKVVENIIKEEEEKARAEEMKNEKVKIKVQAEDDDDFFENSGDDIQNDDSTSEAAAEKEPESEELEDMVAEKNPDGKTGEQAEAEIRDAEEPASNNLKNDEAEVAKSAEADEEEDKGEGKEKAGSKEVGIESFLNQMSKNTELSESDEAEAATKSDSNVDEIALKNIKSVRSINLYKKIALSFMVLALLLLGAVFYFNFSSVTITLIPDQERASNNMIIDIYDAEKKLSEEGGKISGIVKKIPISYEKKYQATGEEVIGEETVGEVVLYNNYSKNQPLVATTRLLSPDNKLFRLKETVNLPAGETLRADVYADNPGPDMAIAPTKFTIPGLWAGLQDKIFAESEKKFEFRQKIEYYITKQDIDNSILDIKQEILKEAKAEISDAYKDYSKIIFNIDEASVDVETEAEAGDEVEEFELAAESEVIVVAFDEERAAGLAKERFISGLSSDKELIEFDGENIIYNLNSFNYMDGSASVNATFEGKVSLKAGSDIIEKDKVIGLSAEQLDAYLTNQPEISGYEVKFFPAFIKKVPNLVDRIKVEIKR